jgi:putative DNA methylase
MSDTNDYSKKLIEVALPLDAINAESAREKSIRHGHPSTLHLWWARRPLAACRAVLFASMVDDPSAHPEKFPTEEDQENERQRLFKIIEELVDWDNINNEKVLKKARREIRKYAPDDGLPPVLDPFAGGGSIPLEAQRLGLEAHAGDLNPVAVLINKAMIEIPPKFAGQAPVNPEAQPDDDELVDGREWKKAKGLAEDVRYYGEWMRDKAEERIGHLYPTVTITQEMLDRRDDLREQGYEAGDELTVIAWIWARTVPSPNPAAEGARVPLARSFWLSNGRRKNVQKSWVEPAVNQTDMSYRFEVRTGDGKPRPATIGDSDGTCLLTGTAMSYEYIRKQGQAGNMGRRLMAFAAEGKHGRIYLEPNEEQEHTAQQAEPKWRPTLDLSNHPQYMGTPRYGLTTFDDLFSDRQLVALNTFSELIDEVEQEVQRDASDSGIEDAQAYADAVVTYLGFTVDKCADYWTSVATWMKRGTIRGTFARQAIPMTWDFAEANPLSDFHCAWASMYEWVAKVLDKWHDGPTGRAKPLDAVTSINSVDQSLISTDPPYYDNVPYADLSDFFYVWLRRSLQDKYPDLFGTVVTPKQQELVADRYRHDGKEGADRFFEEGMYQAFQKMREKVHPAYPVTVFYAFKQMESNGDDGQSSTGWETMLSGLSDANFQIVGTWPMRTERSGRMRQIGSNALASSVVLVCRPRPDDAPRITRGQFLKKLKDEMPEALRDLQRGNIAPVDLAQASIGPGMAIFSRYPEVVEADGSPMEIRTALALINQVLDEYLTEQEGEYDADTRWALAWYDQFGFESADYGDAETLSTAKNTSVQGMVEAGILRSGSGKVRLLKRDEMNPDWRPSEDERLTVWEATQHLIRALEQEGEEGAARLLAALQAESSVTAEAARDLAYRLYSLCERKDRTDEALAYNSLIVAWPQIERLAQDMAEQSAAPQQGELEL